MEFLKETLETASQVVQPFSGKFSEKKQQFKSKFAVSEPSEKDEKKVVATLASSASELLKTIEAKTQDVKLQMLSSLQTEGASVRNSRRSTSVNSSRNPSRCNSRNHSLDRSHIDQELVLVSYLDL